MSVRRNKAWYMAHHKDDLIASTSTKARWVLSGIAASTLTGLVLFYLFSWQQHGQFGNFYLHGVTGQQLFDSARTTAMLIGIVGLGGAGFLAYRRQRTNEEVQFTANHSHHLSEERFNHDTLRTLRERYTTAAEQLGSESFAVRLAGVYAMTALADDWAYAGWRSERQVCIDVLCAYLRAPAPIQPPPSSLRSSRVVPVYVWLRSKARSKRDSSTRMRGTQEREVRQAVLSVIAAKTTAHQDQEEGPWSSCRFDFSGATLGRVEFKNCKFSGPVKFARVHFTEETDFDGALLRSADFTEATFDKVANFNGAHFDWRVEFERADFFGGTAFQRANFDMETSFIGAGFGGAYVDFRHTHFRPNSSTYIQPQFVGGTTVLDFSGASFDGEVRIGEQVRYGRAVLFRTTRPWAVEPTVDWDEATLPSNVYPRSWPPAPTTTHGRAADVVDIDARFPLPPEPSLAARRIGGLLRSITSLSPPPPRQW
ncbi:MAG: hypothetical protein ACJA07_001539 [Rhodococcus sp. (in: high G+C Gram-positive bacteria)]|jgi:hypothetical protein